MTSDEFETLKWHTIRNRYVPIPPDDRNQSGPAGQAFPGMGFALLSTLVNEGLSENASVLDLGCGVGRVALPLSQFLVDRGSYFGIDINLSAIAWCRENITQRYPNFEFAVINARNRHNGHRYEYGRGAMRDVDVLLAPDRKFDAINATSLLRISSGSMLASISN